jgi:hypothetical protein
MIPGPEKPSILDIPLKRWFPLNLETLLVILLVVTALVSRFYDLGARAISHDETNHYVPAYSLYSGNGYQYDPMTHGPLQFHMMALSFALFGDSDFTGRIPAALLNIATILVAIFAFRRYLGRTGALVAGALIIICPERVLHCTVGHPDPLCDPALSRTRRNLGLIPVHRCQCAAFHRQGDFLYIRSRGGALPGGLLYRPDLTP